jgi:DnaJ-class molecular chaperone
MQNIHNLPNLYGFSKINIGNLPNIGIGGNLPNIGIGGNLPNIGIGGNLPNIGIGGNLPRMHDKKDSYYDILGIDSTASIGDIKHAYRKLSLDNHPDRNNGNKDKSEKFKKITEAYKILSDESERKKYDNSINNLMGIDNDIQNIFNNLFNTLNKDTLNNDSSVFLSGGLPFMHTSNLTKGFSDHEYKSKPATISKNVNITLLQAYNGCKLPIDITRWVIESDIKYEEMETMYIDIFKGIDNNEIITIENKGNVISNSNKGDIKIKVLINNHNIFERHGIDLIFKKSITLKESFCGFSFDLPYIDGREFKINNEAGNIIPPNFQKVIPDLGMIRDNIKGNLIIAFDVIYPKQLTKEQVSKLDEIL